MSAGDDDHPMSNCIGWHAKAGKALVVERILIPAWGHVDRWPSHVRRDLFVERRPNVNACARCRWIFEHPGLFDRQCREAVEAAKARYA